MQTESSGGAGLMQFLRDRQSLSPQPLPHYIPTNEYYQNLLARFAPILPKVKSLKQSCIICYHF